MGIATFIPNVNVSRFRCNIENLLLFVVVVCENLYEGERGSDRRGSGGFDRRILACDHGCPRGAKDGVDRHPRSEKAFAVTCFPLS